MVNFAVKVLPVSRDRIIGAEDKHVSVSMEGFGGWITTSRGNDSLGIILALVSFSRINVRFIAIVQPS
jgi:hypothetical protein